jgi:glycosyltransferase involved in cell wall biosynthesis
MSPTVSVVIPVFNRAAAVCRAIDSVLAQTCQDFEIIVVDDGSTDGTVEAVGRYADGRITLVRHDRNRGGSAARNTAIHAGSAPFVAFLDSDDEWLPTKLERQLEVFRRSGSQLGLVYSGFERILEDGSLATHLPSYRGDLSRRLLTRNVVGGTSNGMVRRQVFGAVGGFDEALPSAQDVDLWLRICQRFQADFVPEILARIWQRNEGDRITANVASLLQGRALFCQKHRESLVRNGRLHVWLRQTGWVHHRYAGDCRMARSAYISSIRAQPVAPFTYILLLLACLPLSWLHVLARGKHQLAELFGSLREIAGRSRIYSRGEASNKAERESEAR